MRQAFLLAILIFLGVVSATDFNLVSPWANTTWTSGSSGKVIWTVIKGDSSAPAVTKCDLDLMQGNFTNANVVAHIATGLDVNMGQYLWSKLPDYKSGSDYFVRVGTPAWYRYGHAFTFVGNGTVQSLAIPAPCSSCAAAAGPDNSTSTSSDTTDSSTSGNSTSSNSSKPASGGPSSSSSSSSSSSVSGGSTPSASGKSSAGFNNQANFVLLALSMALFAFCTL